MKYSAKRWLRVNNTTTPTSLTSHLSRRYGGMEDSRRHQDVVSINPSFQPECIAYSALSPPPLYTVVCIHPWALESATNMYVRQYKVPGSDSSKSASLLNSRPLLVSSVLNSRPNFPTYRVDGVDVAQETERQTKQQPSMLPCPAVHGCCLVSFHFLFDILSIHSILRRVDLWAREISRSFVAPRREFAPAVWRVSHSPAYIEA